MDLTLVSAVSYISCITKNLQIDKRRRNKMGMTGILKMLFFSLLVLFCLFYSHHFVIEQSSLLSQKSTRGTSSSLVLIGYTNAANIVRDLCVVLVKKGQYGSLMHVGGIYF